MATWDSYTQKATPADNDTLMIKDTAGAANKRTPFSGVWNWIVNKLTSAVISQLETTNKSIIPAINELNSKFTMNSNETIDCNETTKFLVFCNNDSENLPLTSYGTLMTLVRDQNIRVQLFWSSTSENRMYTRIKSVTGWGAWYLLQLQ